jgi:hypothetical protein
MRWSVVAFLFVAACYSPHFGNPGFFCHPEDVPACPDGQQCVDGRCMAGGTVPVDLGVGGVGGGGSGDSGAPMSMPDLSHPSGPVDMKTPKDFSMPSGGGDMASGGGCVGTGGDCTYHNNAVCCSNYCIYSSNTCK